MFAYTLKKYSKHIYMQEPHYCANTYIHTLVIVFVKYINN